MFLGNDEKIFIENKNVICGEATLPISSLSEVILQVSDLSIAPDPVRLMLVFDSCTFIVSPANMHYDKFFDELGESVALDRDAFLRAMDCPVNCDFTLYRRSEK